MSGISSSEFQIYLDDLSRLECAVGGLEKLYTDLKRHARIDVILDECMGSLGNIRSNIGLSSERQPIKGWVTGQGALVEVDEVDLQKLEAGIPRLMESGGEKLNDPECRSHFEVCKRIVTEVRWGYGPPQEVHRMDIDGGG